jgi:tRNA threonylcarbamoyladenosine biosynthesis protein TsaB
MLLALDTCFNGCSAALYDTTKQSVVSSRLAVMERGHAEAIGPMVEALFAESGFAPSQLRSIAVTRGPGTFTGLRIGLAYAKGMSLALNIPLIGLDSLRATAIPHFAEARAIFVVQQAGGTGLCYWAAYTGKAGTELHAPQIAARTDIARHMTADSLVVGSASSAFPGYHILLPDHPVAARFAPHTSEVTPQARTVEPLYLRAPDAKPSSPVTATVRHAIQEDLAKLERLHAESFEQGWSAEQLASALSLPGSGALVVELAGTVYGFVQFQWVAGEAEINTLCVSPTHRRQHFGNDLMRGLMAELAMLKARRVYLDVADDNHAALALYAAHGFEHCGLRKAYYANGRDAILMQKVLPI